MSVDEITYDEHGAELAEPDYPLLARFWSKTRFDPDTNCIVWTADRNQKGYGRFRYQGKLHVAHRVAYEFDHAIPEGLQLDHLCRNRACVRPDHLEPVTNQENARRGLTGENMRSKTHYPQGHPYDEENTHLYRGSRYCRTCSRDRARIIRMEKKRSKA